MAKSEALSYAEQFKDSTLSFSPFVLRSTGIIQSQTSLKVDTYTLACVPYQLSMNRVVLIGSFSRDEIVFFQRFKNALAGLTVTIQRPTSRNPEKIFCRCQITGIGAMKGRDQVGLVVCEFKPIPPDIAELVGQHLLFIERLKAEFDDFRNRIVQLNPENCKKLGFNNYAIMNLGPGQHKLAMYTISSDRMEFLMPLNSPDLVAGTEASFSLFFQKYRFSVNGTIEESSRLPSGVQKVRARIGFSPELVDLLSEYFFNSRLQAARA